MLRAIAAGGAAVAALTFAGCGHHTTAGTSQDAATLSAYVMDATPAGPASPAPAIQPATAMPGRAATSGQADAPACSRGRDAYRVLVFLVSSDTGTSVRTIVADLRAGQSLADIAGGQTGQVEQQAAGLVQAWLQFAQANGKLTADQAAQYRAAAQVAIDALMQANVASCVPAAG